MTLFRVHREYFSRSFFPSAVREWNELPQHIRQSPSLDSFNRALFTHFKSPTKTPWYGRGERPLDVHHTRLRLGCSKLMSHLHFNLHVEENPRCPCGHADENPNHFFFICQRFQVQRRALLEGVGEIVQPSLSVLLYGSNNLTLEENVSVVVLVQTFIKDTGRFAD